MLAREEFNTEDTENTAEHGEKMIRWSSASSVSSVVKFFEQ